MSSLRYTLSANKCQSVVAHIPDQQTLEKSLHITAPNKKFSDWSKKDHLDSFLLMQKIAKVWEKNNITDQYLIYADTSCIPFHWEMIPYQKCYTSIGRVLQQVQVLWRTTFGGIMISDENRENQYIDYKKLLKSSSSTGKHLISSNKHRDPFCNHETIERQKIISGNQVNVLFNYAPIGFGGERLHFLIVPKNHRTTFTELSQEEYCESLALTSKLVDHFTRSRKNVKNVYFLNKTGEDAGQTVKHWHLHVIFLTHETQSFWGRITVLRNILFGSTPMNKIELEKKVKTLRNELDLPLQSA